MSMFQNLKRFESFSYDWFSAILKTTIGLTTRIAVK